MRDNVQCSLSGVSPRGFALVIALGLMSFILLLLVGLTTLVQVESEGSKQNERIAVARQNALFGLQAALGTLQRYAGPDTRVTATGDLLTVAGDPDDPETVEQRFWTGVWDTTERDPFATERPEALAWLVSGNESLDRDDPDYLTPLTNLPDPGGSGTIRTTWLVRKALESKDWDGSSSTADHRDQWVKAVLQPLRGGGGNSDPITGNYAWWVGDEGVKAKVNVVEPENYALATSGTLFDRRLMGAQRFAVEKTEDFESFDYSDAETRLLMRRVLGVNDVSFVHPLPNRRPAFHDFTVYSKGLLTNPLAGGLKVDLSRGLDDDPLSGNLFSPGSAYDKIVPQWDVLRSYYNLDETIDSSGAVVPSAATATRNGLAPVVNAFSIMEAFYIEPIDASMKTFAVYAAFWAGFTLHNPYNVALAATDYVFETRHMYNGFRFMIEEGEEVDGLEQPPEDRVYVGEELGSTAPMYEFRIEASLDQLPGDGVDMGQREKQGFIRYGSASPIRLEAGEIKAFSTQPGADGSGNLIYDGHYSGGSMPGRYRLVREGLLDEDFILLKLTVPSEGDTENRFPGGAFKAIDLFYPNTIDTDGNPVVDFNVLPAPEPRRIYYSGNGYPSIKVFVETTTGEEMVAERTGSYTTRLSGDGFFYRVVNNAEIETILPLTGGVGHPLTQRNARGGGGNSFRWLADFNYRSFAPEVATLPGGNLFYPPANRNGQTPTVYRDLNSWGQFGNGNGGVTDTYVGDGVSKGRHPIYYDINTNQSRSGPTREDDGYAYMTLFDIPREKVFSLGALRHANIFPGWYGNDSWDMRDAWSPSYIISNSRPHFTVGLDEPSSEDEAEIVYRVNRALWDDYFFSSLQIETYEPGNVLPNPRMTVDSYGLDTGQMLTNLQSRDDAALHLFVDGAFNVNSTSVDAWKMVLGGLSGVIQDPGAAAGAFVDNPFPRGVWNFAPDSTPDYVTAHGPLTGGALNRTKLARAWNGFRALTDEELDALAKKIVEQVKIRGPFLSLADFVNRTLVDRDTRDERSGDGNGFEGVRIRNDTRFSGTLQTAIDSVTEVDVLGSGNNRRPYLHEPIRRMDADNDIGFHAVEALTRPYRNPVTGVVNRNNLGNRINESGTIFLSDDKMNIIADGDHANHEASLGYLSTDAPGFLNQMDILSPLAPILTVRSDTFTVRAYGEAINPLSGAVEGRAWCEAVVQRESHYLNSNDSPETEPADLNGINKEFGRGFRVVSFRWLNEDDI